MVGILIIWKLIQQVNKCLIMNMTVNRSLQSKVSIRIGLFCMHACMQTSHAHCSEMLSHLGWCMWLCCRRVCGGRNSLSFTQILRWTTLETRLPCSAGMAEVVWGFGDLGSFLCIGSHLQLQQMSSSCLNCCLFSHLFDNCIINKMLQHDCSLNYAPLPVPSSLLHINYTSVVLFCL